MVGAIHTGAMRVMRGLFMFWCCLCRGERVDPLPASPAGHPQPAAHCGDAGRGGPLSRPPPGPVRLRRLDLQRSLAGRLRLVAGRFAGFAVELVELLVDS
jgi:hypothetical protein